ncbi:MAG: sigma 54-interacting transcriptional regulator [Kofleriaceae bacterium]
MDETLSVGGARGDRVRKLPALYIGLAGATPRVPGWRLSLARRDALQIVRGDVRALDGETLKLADPRLSRSHARFVKDGDAWRVEDLGSKNGTAVNGRPATTAVLRDGDTILVGATMLVFRTVGGELAEITTPQTTAPGFTTIAAELEHRFAELTTAASSDVPIEITGETGTGKELAARAIHTLSKRKGAFVAVNCGALPANLLEAELFGHAKGAFTGAVSARTGLIRSADRGTLFLDEVAELPPASQAALLRVLQEREVLPLGEDAPIAVDVRLITATHQDLDRAVTDGEFRDDLRARLMGLTLALPPLRSRKEDLGLLVSALLPRDVTFSAEAVAELYTRTWPRNIRELERALAAAAAIAGDVIEPSHLPTGATAADPILDPEDLVLRDQLRAAIARHEGNLAAVARELGKDRTQIRRWMKRFGLDRAT